MVYKSSLEPIQIPVIDTATHVLGSKGFNRDLNRPAYIDAITKESITFRQLKEEAIRLSKGIKKKCKEIQNAKDEKSNEVVIAIFSPNHVHYPIVVHGSLLAGAVITTANPLYTSKELAYQLQDSGASILIVHSGFLNAAKDACHEVGIPNSCIYLMDSTDAVPEFQSFKVLYDEESTHLELTSPLTKEQIQKRESILCYSSGTTGRSKGVQLSHYNIVSNLSQYEAFENGQYRDEDVWIGVLPFFHVYALNISVHAAPYYVKQGFTVVLMPRFDMIPFLEAIQTYRITLLHIVPPLVLALAKHPIVEKYNLSSVRKAISGAAPLGAEISAAFRDRLKIPVVQGYGMTELSPVTHLGPAENNIDGSIGVLIANVEARLVDPVTGNDFNDFHQHGELWVRGPNVMLGYHNHAEATRNTIDSEGWLHTGDIAYVDEKGRFFIADRLKELIKYKGFQVPPAELEAILISHPGIKDAGVIGKPDLESGELPVAFVVKSDDSLTEEQVIQFVSEQVAPHKRLRGGVFFCESIPKASTGKILRRVLKEQLSSSSSK